MRRDRVNPNEPMYRHGLPKCPPHLQGAAREAWDRLCEELAASGVLTTADMEVVALLAAEWARLVDAEQHLAETGPVMTSPNGHLVQNPWLWVVRASAKDVLRLLTELGLTPASRARVSGPKSTVDDDFFPEPSRPEYTPCTTPIERRNEEVTTELS